MSRRRITDRFATGRPGGPPWGGVGRAGFTGLSALLLSGLLAACVQNLSVGALSPDEDSSDNSDDSGDSDSADNNESDDSGDSDASTSTKEDEPGTNTNEDTTSGNADTKSTGPDKVSCDLPEPRSCDDRSCNCVSLALGIGCLSNGSDVSNPETASYTNYSQSEIALDRSALPAAFAPTEGERAVLLGTGRMSDFMQSPQTLQKAGRCDPSRPRPSEFADALTCPSHDIPDPIPAHKLPYPIDLSPVDTSGKRSCGDDASLVGRGDCSNSLQALTDDRHCWDKSDASCRPDQVRDASAFSIQITVPPGVTSLSFDSAFLTAEYPFAYQHPKRFATDAFVVWLRSEGWTGNVLMDDRGHPMTVDNQWLSLKDAQNLSQDCKAPCNEHKLHNFSMQGHAATPWLTTEFPVQAGERILMTFAVMEFGSSFLDSYALIDNLRWGCTTGLKGPVTRLAQ